MGPRTQTRGLTNRSAWFLMKPGPSHTASGPWTGLWGSGFSCECQSLGLHGCGFPELRPSRRSHFLTRIMNSFHYSWLKYLVEEHFVADMRMFGWSVAQLGLVWRGLDLTWEEPDLNLHQVRACSLKIILAHFAITTQSYNSILGPL